MKLVCNDGTEYAVTPTYTGIGGIGSKRYLFDYRSIIERGKVPFPEINAHSYPFVSVNINFVHTRECRTFRKTKKGCKRNDCNCGAEDLKRCLAEHDGIPVERPVTEEESATWESMGDVMKYGSSRLKG